MLYDYGEGKSVVPLGSPILKTETTLAAGASWESDGLEYPVEASKTLESRETWQVSVRGNLGLKRTVWIEKG